MPCWFWGLCISCVIHIQIHKHLSNAFDIIHMSLLSSKQLSQKCCNFPRLFPQWWDLSSVYGHVDCMSSLLINRRVRVFRDRDDYLRYRTPCKAAANDHIVLWLLVNGSSWRNPLQTEHHFRYFACLLTKRGRQWVCLWPDGDLTPWEMQHICCRKQDCFSTTDYSSYITYWVQYTFWLTLTQLPLTLARSQLGANYISTLNDHFGLPRWLSQCSLIYDGQHKFPTWGWYVRLRLSVSTPI